MQLCLTDFYQRRSFSYLQNEQVELGRENGLSEQQIREYAKPCFNFRQMQEIRLAIENNTNAHQRKAMRHMYLDAEQMKKMRLKLEHGELLINPAIPAQVIYTGLISLLLCLGLGTLCTLASQGPYLKLNSETVTLKVDEAFEPIKYIDSVSEKKGTLLLPEHLDTSAEGNYLAVYHLLSQGEDIIRTLTVNIKK